MSKNVENNEEIICKANREKENDNNEEIICKANIEKEKGNDHFKKGEFTQALDCYVEGLLLLEDYQLLETQTALCLHGNAAAVYIKLERYKDAIDQCNLAIEVDPDYIKAYWRRANANECQENYRQACEDYKLLVERFDSASDGSPPPPGTQQTALMARQRLIALRDKVQQQEEKEKAEVMEKLGGLANKFLGMFGMSTNDFQVNQTEGGGVTIGMKQQQQQE